MSFKPFTVKELSTTDRERDTDTESFKVISSFATKYFTVNKTKIFASNIDSESLTIYNLNMRSIYNKENFFKDLKFDFSAICLSETPCVTIDAKKIPLTNLMNIDLFIKFGTSAKEEGSVYFYVNLTLMN